MMNSIQCNQCHAIHDTDSMKSFPYYCDCGNEFTKSAFGDHILQSVLPDQKAFDWYDTLSSDVQTYIQFAMLESSEIPSIKCIQSLVRLLNQQFGDTQSLHRTTNDTIIDAKQRLIIEDILKKD